MTRTKLDITDETVTLSVKVPRWVKQWLQDEPGGKSKAVRRLVKEEQWRREGKYTDVEETK